MRTSLENVQDQLLRSEQFRGKLSQLWAQLQLIKESGRKYDSSEDARVWSSMSEQDMGTITKVSEYRVQDDKGLHLIVLLWLILDPR